MEPANFKTDDIAQPVDNVAYVDTLATVHLIDTKKKVELFGTALADSLIKWVDGATSLHTRISALHDITPFDLQELLKQIDSKINIFEIEFKKSIEEYKKLDKPLSLHSLKKYAAFKKVEGALLTVRDATDKYVTIMKYAKKYYKVNVNNFVIPKNQKALGQINKLNLKRLVSYLNYTHLLEF